MKNISRRISVFAVLLLMLLVCNVFALQTQAVVLSGSGTSSSPYLIKDEADLRQLATNVKNGAAYSGKYFKVTADIALTQTWTPIGTASTSFRGTFDGNGKTISAMTTTGDYSGLFAYIGSGATIKNVTLTEIDLSGDKYLAGIAAYADAGSGAITITDCTVSGTLRDTNDGNMDGYLGGIVGYANAENGTVTISSCTFSGANYCSDYSGGILGRGIGKGTNLQLQFCTNRALIDVYDSGNNCGGIAGYLSCAHVTGCMNFGNVAGNGYSEDNGTSWLGGISGSSSSAVYTGCGNYGNVSTFFGAGIDPSQYGGPSIDSCFNVGSITGSSDGYHSSLIYSGTSYNSYSGKDASGATAYKLRAYFGQTLGQDNYPVPLTSSNRVYQVLVVGEHTGTYYANYGAKIALPELSGCAAYFEGDSKFDPSTGITRDYTLAAKGYHNYKDGVCAWCGNTGVDYVDVGSCGETVAWILTSDGVLTISGTGTMANYSNGSAPWYSYRTQIQSVVIEQGVTSVGNGAFYSLTNVNSVTLPTSVTAIGNYGFAYCTGLTGVTFPNRLKLIGDNAFYGCSKLNQVKIPANVTSLGKNAFRCCTGMQTITLGSGLATIGSYALAETGLETLSIPASVKTVGDYAFYNCASLTQVTFQGSAPTISSTAFYGITTQCLTPVFDSSWSSVAHKNYGGTLTWLIGGGSCGDNATWQLTTDKILAVSGTGRMDTYYFYYGNSTAPWAKLVDYIETVVIGEGITYIGDGSFADCTNLRTVSIPNSVTQIGTVSTYMDSDYGRVFKNCTSLTEITIPKGVTSMAYATFAECSNLKAIYVADGNTAYSSMDGVLYDRYKDTICCYPAGKTGAFKIPSGVYEISNAAFWGCSGLTSVDLNGVRELGHSAFYKCTGLTEITIPSSVSSLDVDAFGSCSNLRKIVFKGDLPSYFNNYAFDYVTANVEYPLSNSTWTISALKGYGGTLTWYCGSGTCGTGVQWELYYKNGKATLNISGSGAMDDFTSDTIPWKEHLSTIQTVVISEGVTTVGAYAFYECTALTSVTLPNSVTTIGDYAFYKCGFSYITLGNKVKTIGEMAFYSCKLTEITFPDSVTTIGRYGFYSCQYLKTVKFGSGMQTVGYTAFAQCTALTSLDLGSSVTTLEQSAFNSCTKLTKVVIPASVTTVGTYAFRACTSLQSVEFLGNAPTFNSNAFNGTTCYILYQASKSGWTTSMQGNYGGTLTWVGISQRGTCGTSAEWILDANGKLFILGSGAMKNYASAADTPWYSVRNNIKKVVLDLAVTSIGDNAFNGCANLNEVNLNRTASLGANAFANCANLQVVIFSGNGTTINASAFTGTTCEMWYPSTASYWSSYANKAYGGDLTWRKTTNIGATGTDMRWALDHEGTLVLLGSGAMSSYSYSYRPWHSLISSVKAVVVGNKITSITDRAFGGCTNLKSVVIGSGVTKIEGSVFTSSPSVLESITFLGDPPTSIYYNAFSGLTATAYYPIRNTKWTSSVMADKGGTITWVPLCTEHEEKALPAVAATCTTTGLTAGTSCSWCNAVLVAQEVIPAKGHFVTGENGTSVPADSVQASCTQSLVCNVCRVTIEAAKGHRIIGKTTESVVPLTISNTATAPFELEDGIYYSTNKTSSSSSDLTIAVQYACSLTLEMGVSSEQNYDKLIVLHNNTEKSAISGETTKTLTLSLSANDKVIVRYKKDGSVDRNQDRGWVKLVYGNVTIETAVDVPAETAKPDCVNGVVCAYCATVIKEPLGHRVVVKEPVPEPAFEIKNESATPFVLTDGKYYSANHGGNSVSELRVIAKCDGGLAIHYGVSSEETYDKLLIIHNGTQIDVISGIVSQKSKSLTLAAGDVVIIRYSKDASVNKNDDQAWAQVWFSALVKEQTVSADTLEPDCTHGVVCSFCDAVVKQALGHTEVVENAVTPTCTEAGYSGDTRCTVCNDQIAKGENLAATGHSINDNGVCENNCGLAYAAIVGDTFYTTVAEAIANANGQVVTVLASFDEAIVIDSDVTIDLAGCALSDVTVAEGAKLSLIDTFCGGTASVTGQVQILTESDGKHYYVANENSVYSAHSYEIRLTHISLDPNSDALGYKAELIGDDVVKAHVKAIGFNLWVDADRVVTKTLEGKTVASLRLKNILANKGGEMTIYGNAFVVFDSGETVTSADYGTSMKTVLQTVDAAWDTFTDIQRTAVQALCDKYWEVISRWELNTMYPVAE